MLIASWNINSLRQRAAVLRRFVRKYQPDIVCLQETKVPDELFPSDFFDALDYPHVVYRGQKGYHGVAIASRLPIERSWSHAIHRTRDKRPIAIELDSGLEIHNVYFPAGGDDPRPERNPKLANKLAFIRSATCWMKRWDRSTPRVLVGDLSARAAYMWTWLGPTPRSSEMEQAVAIVLSAVHGDD